MLIAINQTWDESAGKTKEMLSVDQSRCKNCYYCCYFVFFQDDGIFLLLIFMKVKKRLSLEQELVEHDENAIFSQSEEDLRRTQIINFWELFENSFFICGETTLVWCCAIKCWEKASEHMEGLKPLLLFFPAYQFAI